MIAHDGSFVMEEPSFLTDANQPVPDAQAISAEPLRGMEVTIHVSLPALLSLRARARYPELRIPPLFQYHSNVLCPNLEPCSKGSGHLNHPLYNLR